MYVFYNEFFYKLKLKECFDDHYHKHMVVKDRSLEPELEL